MSSKIKVDPRTFKIIQPISQTSSETFTSDGESDTESSISVNSETESVKVIKLDDFDLKCIDISVEEELVGSDLVGSELFKSDLVGSGLKELVVLVDYKNMSLGKLREFASKNGIKESSKLKKNELLKLLSNATL